MNPANPSTYLICGVLGVSFKGRALVGYDSASRPVGSNFGSSSVSLSSNNLPSHSHSIYLTGGGHTHGAAITIDGFDYGNKSTNSFDYGTKTTNSTGAHTHSVVVQQIPQVITHIL